MTIVNEDQIVKVLRRYNPWWRNAALIREESKPQKRQAFYDALEVLRHPDLRRFAVLSGARRVGKTTILYQMIERLLSDGVRADHILYLSFDNPFLKLVDVDEVVKIYESMFPLDGDRYLFFDEIQYTDDWELWMKILYDSRRNVRLAATGSASPILERGSADSGTGRWRVLKIPTLSFYEYCRLLELEEPAVPNELRISGLAEMTRSELSSLTDRFTPLLPHFNRYLMIGGFPELVLAKDDRYAQRVLREDVVDKVIKRDILSLFNIRSPLLMEKLFLYLCLNSAEIFSAATAAKELENISIATVEGYVNALEMSNLIYIAPPMDVGAKGGLKGRPKIFIADAAIRNAVLMIDDVLSDEKELGVTVETAVYQHVVSFYQGTSARIGYFRKGKDNQKEIDIVIELPREKILCEVKYRNDSKISAHDAIVEASSDAASSVSTAILLTKRLEDAGKIAHETKTPVVRFPALVFLYLLGKIEASGGKGKI